jgi:hypothetical protein
VLRMNSRKREEAHKCAMEMLVANLHRQAKYGKCISSIGTPKTTCGCSAEIFEEECRNQVALLDFVTTASTQGDMTQVRNKLINAGAMRREARVLIEGGKRHINRQLFLSPRRDIGICAVPLKLESTHENDVAVF